MLLDPSATLVFKGNIRYRIHHILSYSALRVIELSAGKVSVVEKGDRANITRVLATLLTRTQKNGNDGEQGKRSPQRLMCLREKRTPCSARYEKCYGDPV